MSYTIVVSVIVEAKDVNEAYNKTLLAMNEACTIPGVSYETTDEWYDTYGEQLLEDEINFTVLANSVNYSISKIEEDLDEVYIQKHSGMSLTYEEKARGWYITKQDGKWIKLCFFKK